MHDSTLMELARIRPTTIDAARGVPGIGEKRLADLGEALTALIGAYCAEHRLATNQGVPARLHPAPAPAAGKPAVVKVHGGAQEAAFLMFQQGRTVDEVATCTDRALSTTWQYLAEFVAQRRPKSTDAWVAPAVYERVAAAAMEAETPRLKPIFDQLGGEVPYEEIRLVLAQFRAKAEDAP